MDASDNTSNCTSNNASHKAGHTFLASLGKTRLRPGGVEASEWLIEKARLTADSQLLEVACNMATTATEIASRFPCKITAIDMDKPALEKARQNVENLGLSDRICIMEANASKLPFADNSFDVVINEAMLTMYADNAKAKLVSEYYRVLKPGGRLLTHDIMLTSEVMPDDAHQQLQSVVKSHVSPMSKAEWQQLFLKTGFQSVEIKHGGMTLLSPRGLIRDEGVLRTLKIIFNGLRTQQNRTRFIGMFQFFKQNKQRLNYIACCSTR